MVAIGVYGPSGRPQYGRLITAYRIDEEAAFKTCSWGRFQIMGFNYRAAGFDSIEAFVKMLSILCFFMVVFAFLQSAYAQGSEALCKKAERNIMSFTEISTKRIASICEGENSAYLVYRFGGVGSVEVEYPHEQNEESWSKFNYSGYFRGGGIVNDARGEYTLSFVSSGVEYSVFQNWSLEGKEYNLGVFVDAPGVSTVLKANKETQTGSLELLNGNPKIRNAWSGE